MLEMLASLLSGAAEGATSPSETFWFVYDEPECPEDLI